MKNISSKQNNLIFFSKIVSTVFFIGYFPLRGGGSWAALLCLLYFILSKIILVDIYNISQDVFFIINLLSLLLYLPLGIFTINRSISKENPDPHHVVFDEWVGMWIPIIFLDYSLLLLIISFFVFRFFDIFKPWPINKFEKLPIAYGVLGDDIIAGIFTYFTVLILSVLGLVGLIGKLFSFI
jgi:phosphatidylglycerophosphatase A